MKHENGSTLCGVEINKTKVGKKKMKKFGKRWMHVMVMVCIVLGMICMVFPAQIQAASTKTKALKAYKKFLSRNITWDGEMKESVSPESCEFALVYIDKDSVPELVVFSDEVAAMAGSGQLYAYKNGKVRRVEGLYSNFSYYKKAGVFSDVFGRAEFAETTYYTYAKGKSQSRLAKWDETTWASDKPTSHYYKIQKGKDKEINKKTYKKELKKLVKSKKASIPKYYRNTAANRNKVLK